MNPDTRLRLILANEPRAYRDTLGAALALLRPEIDVLSVDPAELDAAVRRVAPALVVCSDPTPTVEACVPSWIALHPGYGPDAVISIDGVRTTEPNPGAACLLAAIARVQRLSCPVSDDLSVAPPVPTG